MAILGGGDSEDESKKFVWILIITVLTPVIMAAIAPSVADTDPYAEEAADIGAQFRSISGQSTGDKNIWALTGVYTPYEGEGSYGYTDDGWLYGQRVVTYTPSQYGGAFWAGERFTVARDPENGLYYYTDGPTGQPDVVQASVGEGGAIDHKGATVYCRVAMDTAHISDTFFYPGSKTEDGGGHYYYTYSGWRYAFQPLSSYTVTADGTAYDINAGSSSLSLIRYNYVGREGIAGQLTITGDDLGTSYLVADDIIREYDETNFSAVFDMYFGTLPMHILISLNPYAVASGLSVADCWNGGYWTVMVYTDADPVSAAVSATSDVSPSKVLDIAIRLFTFDLVGEYGLDGLTATVAYLLFNLPIYANLLALCLRHKEVWLIVAVIVAIQSIKFW